MSSRTLTKSGWPSIGSSGKWLSPFGGVIRENSDVGHPTAHRNRTSACATHASFLPLLLRSSYPSPALPSVQPHRSNSFRPSNRPSNIAQPTSWFESIRRRASTTSGASAGTGGQTAWPTSPRARRTTLVCVRRGTGSNECAFAAWRLRLGRSDGKRELTGDVAAGAAPTHLRFYDPAIGFKGRRRSPLISKAVVQPEPGRLVFVPHCGHSSGVLVETGGHTKDGVDTPTA